MACGDIYYTPEYLCAARAGEEGEIRVAVFETDSVRVIYPFVLRMIPNSDLFDIITPYDYGGPLILAGGTDAVAPFMAAFGAYCHETGIVSEFVRFHCFVTNPEHWKDDYDLISNRDNVVIPLTPPQSDIRSAFTSSHRRNLRVAESRGARCHIPTDRAEAFQRFYQSYTLGMDRLGAAERYYFSAEYFADLAGLADDHVVLFETLAPDGSIASSALFLAGERLAHYHLGATMEGYSALKPNNILFFQAALEFQKRGKYVLHLGGASESQESLYRFKRGFSKEAIPYVTGRRIWHEDAYRELTRKGAGNDVRPDFFPAYRFT